MRDDSCFGSYIRFSTLSADEGVALIGPDNLIGDLYAVEVLRDADSTYSAWLINRFGKKIGFIREENLVEKIQIMQARGWTIRALLSLVFFASKPEPGAYSGEVVLLCNDPHYDEAFNQFAKTISNKLAEGIRPNVDLSAQGVQQVIETNGSWCPDARVDKPHLRDHEEILKEQLSNSDKLVESGRQRKIGCLIGTAIFWVVLIGLVIFGALKLLQVI